MDTSLSVALITAASTIFGLGLAWFFGRRVLRPPMLPASIDREAALKFAEGERDRMQTVAKGVAAVSSGFLAAVLTALIEGAVADQITPVTLVLVLLGSIGMLLLAAAQSQASARYMAKAVTSYSTPTTSPRRSASSADEVLPW